MELDGAANIISYEEYHPYGTTAFQAKSATINAVAKRYRYTGKERDEESGLYYHGARYYIPWLARWTAIDPMESKYAGMSPYNYSFNNPVMWNDLNGADAGDPPKDGDFRTESGIDYVYSTSPDLNGNGGWNDLPNFVDAPVNAIVDYDLARYAINPEHIKGLINWQQKNPYSIDLSTFEFKPQATISKGSPYNAEYQAYLSNQRWLKGEMAARRTLDPTGHDLAASPGVQAGLEFILPGYGFGTGSLLLYSGIKTDNKLGIALGGFSMLTGAAGAYSSVRSLNMTRPSPTVNVGLKQGYTYRQGNAKDPGLDDFIAALEAENIPILGKNMEIIDDLTGEIAGEIDVLTPNAAIQYKDGVSGAKKNHPTSY